MHKFMIGLLGALLAITVPAQKKHSKTVPAELAHDQYVALGYDLGGGFLSDSSGSLAQNQVLPQDRQALDRVRAALESWNHYVITMTPDEAQLLIAVRTGRLVSAGGIGLGQLPSRVYGAEVSPPDDMLEVYRANNGREGALLWRKSEKDGLSGSPPPLFEQFHRDVDSIPAHKH
jgi:hypothetical protein